MGRMHSKGKGMSKSALPYKRSPPSWVKATAQEVTETICKLAKKGHTPSQIGVILRDSHGIPQVGSVTSSKVLRILKGHGLAPELPEDLYFLIKKAVNVISAANAFGGALFPSSSSCGPSVRRPA